MNHEQMRAAARDVLLSCLARDFDVTDAQWHEQVARHETDDLHWLTIPMSPEPLPGRYPRLSVVTAVGYPQPLQIVGIAVDDSGWYFLRPVTGGGMVCLHHGALTPTTLTTE